MSEWQALIIGLVEGITEYLPVSSTGHLILTQKLLGIPDSAGVRAFEIVVQAGAILAVIGVYARRFQDLIRGVLGKSSNGLQLAVCLVISFLPAAITGLATEKFIDKANLITTSIAWIAGGVVILVFERRRQRTAQQGADISTLTFKAALIIGLLQMLALCPGVSRSLVCLLGGLIVGLSFAAALEYSFLLGGITLLAASGYKAVKYHNEILHDISPICIAIGLIAATLAAFGTVRWMLRSLNRFGLAPFGLYRIALGIAVLTLLTFGVGHK